MLMVTEGARHRLAKMLGEIEAPAETVVRLVLVGADGMIVTEPGITLPGDTSFEHEGRAVLALDEQVGALLDDQILYLDDISQELELRPQCLPNVPLAPDCDSAGSSRGEKRDQDDQAYVSDTNGRLWSRAVFDEEGDGDAVYH
jgi:hypothetical protein